MPQMAPSMWFNMNFMIMIMLMIMMTYIFFMKSNHTSLKKQKKIYKKTWLW